jgi:hypothetical protein
MRTTALGLALLAGIWTGVALAQERPQQSNAPGGGREPPPQAYEDCKGRKVGDAVQHTTPEGRVAAICMDSPRGLVARPNRGPTAPGGVQSK